MKKRKNKFLILLGFVFFGFLFFRLITQQNSVKNTKRDTASNSGQSALILDKEVAALEQFRVNSRKLWFKDRSSVTYKQTNNELKYQLEFEQVKYQIPPLKGDYWELHQILGKDSQSDGQKNVLIEFNKEGRVKWFYINKQDAKDEFQMKHFIQFYSFMQQLIFPTEMHLQRWEVAEINSHKDSPIEYLLTNPETSKLNISKEVKFYSDENKNQEPFLKFIQNFYLSTIEGSIKSFDANLFYQLDKNFSQAISMNLDHISQVEMSVSEREKIVSIAKDLYFNGAPFNIELQFNTHQENNKIDLSQVDIKLTLNSFVHNFSEENPENKDHENLILAYLNVHPEFAASIADAIITYKLDEPEAIALIRLLARQGDEHAQQALITIVENKLENPQEVLPTLGTMALLSNPSSKLIDFVQKLTKSDSNEINKGADLVVGALIKGRDVPDKANIVESYHRQLAKEADLNKKFHYLKVLGNIASPSSYEVISKFLKDQDSSTRFYALHALRQIENPESFKEIEKIYHNDSDKYVKQKALEVLKLKNPDYKERSPAAQ